MCRRSACPIYIYNPLLSLLTYFIRLQLNQMCPFPESFLRAISTAEEFLPVPIAGSTTGGPIILIPYRDSEGAAYGFSGQPSHTGAF